MTEKPGNNVRLRRNSQKVVIALFLAVLIVGAASAQWGGWWGNSSRGGGWWGNQQPSARSRAVQQQQYQQQQYQQQYNPSYPSGQQPAPRAATQQRTYSRRRPPVLAYAPEDQESRRSRSSSTRGTIRIRGDRADERNPGGGDGSEISYCVRLCDGRYFPLSDPGRMKPEEMCSALCPASATKVFEGSTIDEAAAADGSRYEKLKSAFLYRKELVEGCTCNGKNVFGLANIDPKSDPTLQAGDIVVMTDGLNVYGEKRGSRRKFTAHFTPIRKSPLVSRSFRRTLDRIEIVKTRPRSQQQAQQATPDAKPDQPDLTD